MEDGFMLRQNPVTGLYEQIAIEPEVLEEWEEEVEVAKPKSTAKPVEKKK